MNSRPNILVIGNCTVDLSFMVPRFPRAGETLLASDKAMDLGGKGANQAVAAGRFGADARLAAPIGRDPDGEWAVRRLAGEGIGHDDLLRTSAATDLSLIYITPDGENSIVSSHGAAASASVDWVQAIVGAASEGTILLMQGNLSLETTRAALKAARERGLTTVLNPAPIQYAYDNIFPFTDILVLNETEAMDLGGEAEPIASAKALHSSGISTVIVTLGARGAVAFTDKETIEIASSPVVALDTVGAGVVFCGTLVATLGRKTSVHLAMRVAVDAATLSVTRRGTQSAFPSIDEARELMIRNGVRA
jgi:ribokinase